jgi:ketose-bisphosphate aldolase
MIVPLPTLLADASEGGYAVGYFEAWDSYSLEAVVEAAEAEQAPVILGFGCMMVDRTWLDNGGIGLLGCIGRSAAARARIPVSLLLNETHTYEEALEGIEAGFNAVMLDTSAWPWDDAVESVSRLVQVAHGRGVAVEAELGHLPVAADHRHVVDGAIDDTAAELTDPARAATFVHKTGVDCLAVSIGNVHLLLDGLAPVDLALVAAIHQSVRVPLAIHGGSSFPPEAVPDAILHGVAKFNVGTVLKRSFLAGVRGTMEGWPAGVNVHAVLGSHREADVMAAGKTRMRSTVQKLMRLYGSSSHAG